MSTLLLSSWILIGAVGFGYLFRFQLRRWWGANVVRRDLPPHQRWPEILQWRAGDEFRDCSYHCNTLVSITEDGYAVIDWRGNKSYAPLSSLVGHNASARTRRIDSALAQSDEYMELINQFNISLKELQERDKKLRVAS